MREQLIQYVRLLFAGTPDNEDMQQEILQNTLDRYDDLIDQGKQPEAAYRLAIAGIGDINELLGNDSPVQADAPKIPVEAQRQNAQTNRKKNIMHAIAIALYICCVIPAILLANVGDGILGVCLMFVIIAIATVLIILSSGGNKQAESVNKETKKQKSIWSTITLVIYLVLSFATGAWHITWLVFPIAGAVEGLVKSFKLSEKSKSILRAIPYTLLIVILIIILIACLGLRYFPMNLPLTTGTPVEDEVTLDAATVKNLQIDWASGNVTIQTADVNKITIVESSDENTKHKATYKLDGDTLQLSFSNRVYIFGTGSLPSKDLTITVPHNWLCDDLELYGASITIDISGLQTNSLSLDGAFCTLHFNGSVDHVDIGGASMDIQLNCINRVSSIEVDGASCTLDLTLPQGCGFVVDVDGLSYGFHTELPITTEGDQKVYGDKHCQISIDGLSCEVTIAQAPSEPPEDPKCNHKWDGGTQVSTTEILYTCTLCSETYTVTDDNLVNQEKYLNAEALAAEGKKGEAAIAFAHLVDYMDSRKQSFALWNEIRYNTTIAQRDGMLLGILSDGTVIVHSYFTNPYTDVEGWTNLCSISTGRDHVVGLRTDGTVVATGDNAYGQCDVSEWTDIVAIDCGSWFTVGLKADGTVILAGALEYDLEKAATWTDIVMLEAAGYNLIGLRYDGTALALGKEDNDLRLVPGWNDIIDIYLDHQRAIYLRADGTIQVTGNALYIQNQKIPGLQTVESDGIYLAGKLLNGTLYFEGYGYPYDINTNGDIITIIDYSFRKLGLCSDGRLVFLFMYSESNAEGPQWKNIMHP